METKGTAHERYVRDAEKEPVYSLCGLQVEPAPETGHYQKPRQQLACSYSAEEAASALGGSSSSSPLGMPSLVAVTSSSRRNSSSDGVEDPGAATAPGAPAETAEEREDPPTEWNWSAMVRFSRVSAVGSASRASSVVGATPMSEPRASRASASNSFRLGNSCKSLRPNRIKNSLEDL